MKAVVLAGGKGTRLAPFSLVFPKPLMPLGEMPILEVVLRQLSKSCFKEVTIAVGHLHNLIRAYFDNTVISDLTLNYHLETSPLGTAGPLGIIEGLDDTFLVINGDVLTMLKYEQMLDHHRKSGAMITIALHSRDVHIDYGVIETTSRGEITGYIEKPTIKYKVSMGIYMMEPGALKYIKPGEPLDIPDLVRSILREGGKIEGYDSEDYWMDIGRPEDYKVAIDDFERLRGLFL